MEYGADARIKDDNNLTAEAYASERLHTEVVKLLKNAPPVRVIIQSNVNKTSNNGFNSEIDKTLKLSKADIATANQLIQLAIKGKLEPLNMENPNVQNVDGETILMTAAKYGYKDIVDYLINIGCDVNIKNNVGYTALMYASKYGYIDTVRLLVNNGADVNAKNNSGYTASKIAELTRNSDIQQYLNKNSK